MRPDPRVGTELGPYRIEAVLGRGGMGVVYLATDGRLDRRVALKLLSPELADDAAFRTRFLRESRLAASIDDPNIIPVYEAGEIDGLFYLAMRYVEGTDLESRLREGPLSPADAVHVLAQVASALDAAHERGLVHRDVKPANILIAAGKGPGRPDHAYLTDFGLTKHRGSQTGITRAGAFLGTLDYIAPEQIEAKPVDGRADQYALACMTFQCLTGIVPFARDSDPAIMMAHLRDAPPSATAKQPALPAEVDAVIARGMAKKPDDRFPTSEAFVTALRQALGVRPTEERRVPLLGRRWRSYVLGALGVAIIAVAGGIWLAGGGPGPLASASPSPSETSAAGASPSAEPFPNANEAALLDVLPPALKTSCQPGSYDLIVPGEGILRDLLASILCRPGIASGATDVLIRQFRGGFKFDALTTTIQREQGLPPGDCATGEPGAGRWLFNGKDAGAILCFNSGTAAVLYWTHTAGILVKATNSNLDSSALYGFFKNTARFISP